MKIGVVGGGPAGLYFSFLMKKNDPLHDICVYEQNPADATYGWGVVFSDVALSFIREADPEFYREFTANHTECHYMEIVHRGVHVQLRNNHFSRAARIDLLNTLQQACDRVGVQMEFGTRVEDVNSLAGNDLIVAADGANSSVRKQFEARYQPTFETRRNQFAWYGTRQLFHPVSLVFRRNEHGIFIAHAYQYSRDLSTFLVEVDPDTWQRAGLDRMSDAESRHYCANVFHEELGSNELLSNRSLWFRAQVVRNERWMHSNIILIGDALRTVHFSLGAGTRMALQDAIALQRALARHGSDIGAACREFEVLRRPATDVFQTAASRSLDWYENVANRMHLDPISFAYDYMRRTGRVSHEDLRDRDPHFVSRYEALRSTSCQAG